MLMRAVIRQFHSPDALDLDHYVPNDPKDDAILLQVMVGPSDGPGGESFDVLVCTPSLGRTVGEVEGALIRMGPAAV